MQLLNKKTNNKNYKAIPSIIPEVVFYEDSLSAGAKVFYGMCVFLYRNSNRCNASTYYFSKQMARSTRSIQLYISELYEKRFITLEREGTARYITPIFMPFKDTEVVSYIPPEVVKYKSMSSSSKLTYGVVSYLSANENGYFETSIVEVAALISKSTSTVYRHIQLFRYLQLGGTVGSDNRIKIYTNNTYQKAVKKRLKLRTASKEPPKQQALKSTITDSQAAFLRELVGK